VAASAVDVVTARVVAAAVDVVVAVAADPVEAAVTAKDVVAEAVAVALAATATLPLVLRKPCGGCISCVSRKDYTGHTSTRALITKDIQQENKCYGCSISECNSTGAYGERGSVKHKVAGIHTSKCIPTCS
jgi:hypothetical protein